MSLPGDEKLFGDAVKVVAAINDGSKECCAKRKSLSNDKIKCDVVAQDAGDNKNIAKDTILEL
jgi:hypothetical protein